MNATFGWHTEAVVRICTKGQLFSFFILFTYFVMQFSVLQVSNFVISFILVSCIFSNQELSLPHEEILTPR